MVEKHSRNIHKNSVDDDRKLRKAAVSTFILYCFLLFSVLFLASMLFCDSWMKKENFQNIFGEYSFKGDDECQMQLVESIPERLDYPDSGISFMSTYQAWKTLLNTTEKSLDIGSFYWTLRGKDVIDDPSASQGEDIFQNLIDLGLEGKVKIRIAQSISTENNPNHDTEVFTQKGAAEIRSLNFTRLLGGGVLHTKFWISDNKHVYLGSANMDWRSLTQVKELGVLATNCTMLARDLRRVFEEYWVLSTNDSYIPHRWPSEYSTAYNLQHPMILNINNAYQQFAFLSSSPPPLTANGRVDDIVAIVATIKSAKHFVNVAVMDYYPLLIYTKNKKYWPHIDDALKEAAINRGVKIKMLVSWWRYSNPSEDYFLKSLQAISNSLPEVDIQIKRFVVPVNEHESLIPYARVNHNKYMVTDNTAYIGTSNWSGDYFTNTAGVALVMQDNSETATNHNVSTMRTDLLSVFERDWNSPFVRDL